MNAGESTRGLFPLAEERRAEYEAWRERGESMLLSGDGGARMRFRSDPSQIRGSIAPVVTPFDRDGAVDLEALTVLVEWQIESGSHGISVHGSTGEPSRVGRGA